MNTFVAFLSRALALLSIAPSVRSSRTGFRARNRLFRGSPTRAGRKAQTKVDKMG